MGLLTWPRSPPALQVTVTVTALDTRRATLGGSTIAAAVGIDPFCSPIRLWLDLTQGREREETEAMRLGKRLEPVIFEELNERGYTCTRGAPTLYDPERPWLVGHPDGYGEGDVIVEAKATGRASELPHPWHEAQVQTYMHLADVDHSIIAQLAGLTLTVWEVDRRQHLIDVLLRLAEEFIGYVRSGEQPPPAGHRDDRAALLALWPDATPGKKVRETKEVRDARRELSALLEREKAWKARVEHLRAVVTDHMGDADTLVSSHDETVATWRNTTSRRLDTAALKTRRPDVYDLYSTETTTRRLLLP